VTHFSPQSSFVSGGTPLQRQHGEPECQRRPSQRVVAIQQHLLGESNGGLRISLVAHRASSHTRTHRGIIHAAHHRRLPVGQLHDQALPEAAPLRVLPLQSDNLLVAPRHREQQRLVIFACHNVTEAQRDSHSVVESHNERHRGVRQS